MLPGWQGFVEAGGCPVWRSPNNPSKTVVVSVEPSGLLIEGKMPSEEFSIWTDKFIFINLASEALKFEVKNAEA